MTDIVERLNDSLSAGYSELRKEAAEEIMRLRAKIEKMVRQEPVAHIWRCDNGHIHGSCERELPMGQQLYALPGAKGEEK